MNRVIKEKGTEKDMAVRELADLMMKRFDGVDKKFTDFREYVDTRFDALDDRIDAVELRLDKKIDFIEKNMARKHEIQALVIRIDEVEQRA